MPDTRKAAAAHLRSKLADDPDHAVQELDPALILAAIRQKPSPPPVA